MKIKVLTGPVRSTAPILRLPASYDYKGAVLAFESDDDDDTPRKKVKIKGSASRNARVIEKVRAQERGRQQTRIAKLEKQIRLLTKQLNKSEGSLEALREAKTADGTIDVEALLSKAHRKWTKLAERNGGDDELRSEVAELTKKLQKYETRELRRKLIAEAGGEDTMIVEMVTGNTEEEIEASIEKAQAAFDKYGGKKQKRSGDDDEEDDSEESDEDEEDDIDDEEDADESDDDENTSGKDKRRKVPPTMRNAEERDRSGGRKGDRLLKSAKSMSPGDYAKNRSKLLDNLRSRYTGGATPLSGARRPMAGRR